MSRWLKYIIFFGTFIFVAIIGILTIQRTSDGPLEFLQGGSFKTGELVEEAVTDWSFGTGRPIEFELVGFGTSRTAGYTIHEGVAYMMCDLGFMFNRPGKRQWLANLIYILKTWHSDALEDGRALLRIKDKLYKVQLVKVEDPTLNATLRLEMEALARKYYAPRKLGPRSVEAPNDVWFFRMDPRPETVSVD